MKIAVTYENGQIFAHFGRAPSLKVYSIEGGQVKDAQVIDTEATGHSALVGLLQNQGVDILICGGIGTGAKEMLGAAGIQIYAGAAGDADAAVFALLAGTLRQQPGACSGHHDEGASHTCGEHGCGAHGCHHT